ncbi:Laccase domain protein yfiH [Legionella lansingensis]|uniref:Purine nucleoside phosphorylase n=1 Tax=Legionella lansingensis TaxID=45067 RepID=A0A0W0VRN8_9GAMM|nr:Laccase domain protein YfiH [Legionella lansingensis]SNV49666.1 Laccase domain protein yfiH [Legionella lansingensis]
MTKLHANWPSPSNVKAFTTLRHSGFSKIPFDSNNLAAHVGDNPDAVSLNRQQLRKELGTTQEPAWLEQIHSNVCVVTEEDNNRVADAAITRTARQPLAILTADCLPILLCNQEGNEIAAIHAGWRGLVNGIVENTLARIKSAPDKLMAWIGPAICQSCYETGPEVLESYQKRYPFATQEFRPIGEKWHANLAKLAERILNYSGVTAVYQSNSCTFEQKNDFYSYRRESQTGRMATLIWFTETFGNKQYDYD